MLNKELNGEMEVMNGKLENEQVDIECIFKCADIMHRFTNDCIHLNRLAQILGAEESDIFYIMDKDGTYKHKHIVFGNLHNGIKELEVVVSLNKNDITNKDSLHELKDELEDLKYVSNCISIICKLPKRGTYIKGIKELPDNQVQYYTTKRKHRDGVHRYTRIKLENLCYNDIKSLIIKIVTNE